MRWSLDRTMLRAGHSGVKIALLSAETDLDAAEGMGSNCETKEEAAS